jgi:hypothetical protein
MSDLTRLDELAQIAAEQALDILSEQAPELVEDVRLVELAPAAGSTESALRVTWRIEYDEANSFPVSMLLLEEYLEDEEALVLSMAAWILHSVRSGEGEIHAQA